jgi:hypothetical protein
MPTFKHPCPHCGKYIERDVAACPFCGTGDPFAPRRCPNCRAPIDDAAWRTCPKCGTVLASAAPVQPAEPPAVHQTAAPAAARKCTGCGAPLTVGARFCTTCGTLAP